MEIARRLAAGAVFALSLLGAASPACAQSYDTSGDPEELPYREGDPVPLGYHPERRPRGELVAASSVLFGLSYGFAVAVGASDGFQNKKGYLLLPLFGPVITVTARYGTRASDLNLGAVLAASIDTALQASGLFLLLREELSPRPRLVRDAKSRLCVSPEFARDFVGPALTGQL